MKLRNTIFRGFIIVAFIPLLLTSIFLYIYSRQIIENNVKREISIISGNAINKIDRFMFERLNDVKTWSQLTTIREHFFIDAHNDREKYRELRAINKENPIYLAILLIDAEGKIIESSNPNILQNQLADQLLVKEPWYREAKASKDVYYYSDVFFSAMLNKNAVAFSATIKDKSSSVKGTVVAYVDTMFIYEIIENVIISTQLQEEKGFIAVYGNEGLLFLAPEFQRKLEYNKIKESANNLLPKLKDGVKIKIADNYYLVGLSKSQNILDYIGRNWKIAVFQNIDIAFAKIALLRNLLFVVVAVVIVMSLLVARYSSIQISRPINILTGAVEELSQNLDNALDIKADNLKTKFASDVQDEVGKLFSAISKMVEVIKARTIEVERFRKKAVDNARLVAIGQTAAQIAHDVRKPLTGMKALLTVLPEKKNDEVFMRNMVRNVEGTINRTNTMLSEILEFSKDSTTLERKNHDPQSTIIAALGDALRDKVDADVNIEYELKHQNYLDVDGDRIIRVLTNIIGNAVEAMDGCGRIWIRTEDVLGRSRVKGEGLKDEVEDKVEDRMKIVIGNNGPVIPEGVQKKLFDPFFTKGKKGGTGLGLSICQKIVEMHGGSIRVSSFVNRESSPSPQSSSKRGEEVPSITEFIIELPASEGRLSVNEAELIHHSDELKPFREEEAVREKYGDTANIADFMKRHKEHGQPFYLLLVDDEPLFRETVRSLLNRIPQVKDHVKVVEADSAEMALSQFRAREFDYVIADIDMGKCKMNGYEMSRIILEKYPNTYVLIHSNKRREEMDKNIREIATSSPENRGTPRNDSHFMGFLPKPMKQSELLQFLACKTFEVTKVAKSPAVPAKKMLIVNDDPDLLLSFKILLKSPSLQVLGASNISEAFNHLTENHIDIILSDINLGDDEPDGYEFLKQVREKDESIPFYLISGYSRSDEEPKARKLGANGYLQLPVEKEQLMEIIQ